MAMERFVAPHNVGVGTLSAATGEERSRYASNRARFGLARHSREMRVQFLTDLCVLSMIMRYE